VNCFPEEVGTQVVSVFEFWELDRLLFMARDLTAATFSVCHQKLPLPWHQKLSCFLIENFPALPSKTSPRVIENSPALSSKLSRFVIETFSRCHPERSEAPAERSRRTPRLCAAPAASRNFHHHSHSALNLQKCWCGQEIWLFWARFLSTGCCCAYPAELQ
jgi:hypothetical protein